MKTNSVLGKLLTFPGRLSRKASRDLVAQARRKISTRSFGRELNELARAVLAGGTLDSKRADAAFAAIIPMVEQARFASKADRDAARVYVANLRLAAVVLHGLDPEVGLHPLDEAIAA